MQTGFIPVFEEKLKKLLKKIQKEYEKPKADRDKHLLRKFAREAKDLRKLIKKCKDDMGGQCCPNCGCEL